MMNLTQKTSFETTNLQKVQKHVEATLQAAFKFEAWHESDEDSDGDGDSDAAGQGLLDAAASEILDLNVAESKLVMRFNAYLLENPASSIPWLFAVLIHVFF